MNHTDHIYLLEGDLGLRDHLHLPIRGVGGTWADLGSGGGAFTLALADLLGPGAVIHSIDQDQSALREQEQALRSRFPETQVDYQRADFTRPLNLPALDGLVMANSLHFIPPHDKPALLKRLLNQLKPGGQFLLVEYNVDRGNMWVPYPFSYGRWEKMAQEAGYTKIYRLGSRPSRFLGEIYSSVALKEEEEIIRSGR